MLNIQARNWGTIAVLSLQGQIVNGETELLRKAVQLLPVVSAIKLDFARVTTVDAGGLGTMLALRAQLQSKGIRFELMNVNKRIRTVLELTRLDSVFQITGAVELFPAVSRNRQSAVAPLASCA